MALTGCSKRRHLLDAQPVGRPRGDRPDRPPGREELAARIGPEVFRGAGHVNRPGATGRSACAGRPAGLRVAELLVVAAEPVGETRY